MQQQELFETAFKFSPISMALVSPEGKWLKVNCALLKYLGYEEEEFLRLDFLQMTHPEDLKADIDLLNETIAGLRDSYQLEKRYIHKDGSIVYGLLSVSLIRNKDKTPEFFISQIQDITELKQTQKNLQANSKLMAIGEMAAGIAHEINNPLTIINLNTRALEQLVLEPELDRQMINQFAHKIGQTVKRIGSIVSSLRKFASEGQRPETFEHCVLDTIIEDALGLCSEKFRASGVTLNLAFPENVIFECNPVDISQVLINLLNNSYYAIKDLSHKEITIGARVENDSVLINVMDSGPGIPVEYREKLLDPFFTTKPIGQGTGLGLSISRTIVQVHHGELYLDQECKHTNFVIRLPLKQTQMKSHLSKYSEASKTASKILPM